MRKERKQLRDEKNARKKRAHVARLKRSVEVDFGESIFRVVDPGRSWRIEARDVPKLRRLIGDQLLIPFAKTFVGADQLESFHYLMHLNGEVTGVAHDRNFWTMALMIWGTMRELSGALDDLRRAGIEKKIDDVDLWNDLDAVRKRWHGDGLFIKIRNQLCFHLGESSMYKRALDEWKFPRALVIAKGDVASDGNIYGRDTRLILGEELRLRGTGMDTKELSAFVDEALKHHGGFSDKIQRLWASALRKAGLPIGPSPAPDIET
jgi:hypothetical protein